MGDPEYVPEHRKVTLTALVRWVLRSVYRRVSKMTQTHPTTYPESAGSVPVPNQSDSMVILLERFCYHPEGTLGLLTVGDEEFYTVERPWEQNLPRISCIPEGEYEMKRRKSPKFGWCWEVKDVPNRTYILFHSANFPDELQGCIAPGMALMTDRIAVSRSRDAMKEIEELTHEKTCSLVIKFATYAALKSQ